MTTSLDTSPARVATPGPEEQWRANLRGKSVSATLVGARADDWYTGVKPGSTCPGWDDGKLRSLPLPNIATADRATALDYFNNSWTLTEVLFAALQGVLERGRVRVWPSRLAPPAPATARVSRLRSHAALQPRTHGCGRVSVCARPKELCTTRAQSVANAALNRRDARRHLWTLASVSERGGVTLADGTLAPFPHASRSSTTFAYHPIAHSLTRSLTHQARSRSTAHRRTGFGTP